VLFKFIPYQPLLPQQQPVVMATNRFYSKTKLATGSQERRTLKRSCYAI